MSNASASEKSGDKVAVFISYSQERGDKAHNVRVKELADALEEEGFKVYFDKKLGKQGPPEGFPTWVTVLEKAHHRIVVLSPHYGLTPGSKKERQHLHNLKDAGAPEHKFTCVFFDARYRNPGVLEEEGEKGLTSRCYDFADGTVKSNEGWKSLVERVHASRPTVPAGAAGTAETKGAVQVMQNPGIILVGDIMDFSSERYDLSRQQEMMEAMWGWLWEHQGWKGWKLLLDSTLDGAIVVFPLKDIRVKSVPEMDALAFAEKWLKFMEREARVGFRIGIDLSEYTTCDLSGSEAGNNALADKIIGRGPNDADRLTRLAGNMDIIVSDDFVRSLLRKAGRDRAWQTKFSPECSKGPHQARPKAHRLQEFRLYTGHKPEGGKGPGIPETLRRLQAAKDQLEETLAQVCHEFWDWLDDVVNERILNSRDDNDLPKGFQKSLNRKKVFTRVSLFLRNPEEPEKSLACTEMRIVDPILPEGLRKFVPLESSTFYSIEGSGQGPAGRAFVSGKPVVLHALPDPEQDWKGYVKHLSKLGMDASACQNGSRKARSFICFPCGINNLPPVAVVCIDCMTDLGWFTRKELDDVAALLQDQFGLVLALLQGLR